VPEKIGFTGATAAHPASSPIRSSVMNREGGVTTEGEKPQSMGPF
jgi:hypothetical protein